MQAGSKPGQAQQVPDPEEHGMPPLQTGAQPGPTGNFAHV
jgi:hypothetical protein